MIPKRKYEIVEVYKKLHTEAPKGKRLGFIGFYPSSLPWGKNENNSLCAALKKQMAEEIKKAAKQEGITGLVCAARPGLELYFCEQAIQLTHVYSRLKHLTLTVVAPPVMNGERRESGWDMRSQERYRKVLSAARLYPSQLSDFLPITEHLCTVRVLEQCDMLLTCSYPELSGEAIPEVAQLALQSDIPTRVIPIFTIYRNGEQ